MSRHPFWYLGFFMSLPFLILMCVMIYHGGLVIVLGLVGVAAVCSLIVGGCWLMNEYE